MTNPPPPPVPGDAPGDGSPETTTAAQITQITSLLTTLTQRLARVEARQDLPARPANDGGVPGDDQDDQRPQPAAWAWFSPPAAAEDDPDPELDPRFTVDNFVAFYNVTYVGAAGGRAKPIPNCWRDHPGLAAEIACLAYSWRDAHTGRSASARDATYWHHQWRPGFTDRMTRDWLGPDCHDGQHEPTGAAPRDNRFTTEENDTQPPGHPAGP